MMKLPEQQAWYEAWHSADKPPLPVEVVKQSMRLEAIVTALESVSYASALVIGCGQGDEIGLLRGQITAFDLSHHAVSHARSIFPAAHYLQADGMRLPFADGSFDLVLTSEVLEHILEPENMLLEICRVLKPGGRCIITTPNWQSFFGLARWGAEAILRRPVTSDNQPVDRWSTPRSLERLLAAAGFSIQSRYGAWYFPPTGLGMKRLPDKPTAAFFRRMLPIERRLRVILPGWGHLLVVVAQSPK